MKIFVFIGPAGSGKGTQAQYLSKEYGFNHLSTGDMLRKEVADNSELGKTVKSVIESGNLVTDDIILNIIIFLCVNRNASKLVVVVSFYYFGCLKQECF